MEASDARDMGQIAVRLEAENPLWIVVFGSYSRQFVAFPRFDVPFPVFLASHSPAALAERMGVVEARRSTVVA